MICTNCNSEIPDNSQYCSKCGFHLPGFKRGKPTFDVDFLKKAFSFKKKENPVETKEEWVDVKPKKKSNWGWGWYILAAMVFYGIKKSYEGYGDTQSMLVVSGTVISVLIYFYFRNKILTEISTLMTRSFLSGFISMIFTMLIVTILAGFLPKDSEDDITEKIVSELGVASKVIEDKLGEETLLMEDFVAEPTTEYEAMNNIVILNKSLVINDFVDSVHSSTFGKTYYAMLLLEKDHPEKMSKNHLSSTLILSLLESFHEAIDKKNIATRAFMDYYNAWIKDSNDQDELFDTYLQEAEVHSEVTNKYLELVGYFDRVISNYK